MTRWLFAAFLLGGVAVPVYGQCEPSLPVRRILETTWAADFEKLPYKEGQARRRQMYDDALAAHPHDYFLLRMRLSSTEDDETIGWARSLREKNPNEPVYQLVYAQALAGHDTPEAIRILYGLKAAHPELTRAHLVLADNIYGYGNFKDGARAAAEVTEFVKACPALLDTAPLRSVGAHGTKEQMAALAAGVRKRITEMPQELMAGVWEALWSLEFRARPPAGHAELRKEIAADLAPLEKAPGRETLRWATFLRDGYQSAGDTEAVRRLNDEILARYPRSEAAKRELMDRWRKEHKYPPGGDKAQLEAFRRAVAEAYGAWLKTWPEDSMIYSQLFSAASHLPEAKAAEVARMGDEVMALYRKNPNWYGYPPLEFQVADAFLTHKVNVEKVPGLVEEGIEAAAKRYREEMANDQFPDEMRTILEESRQQMRMERARLLLGYYAAVKRTEGAHAIEEELAALHFEKAGPRSTLLDRKAQAAEVLGRKLDALTLYRAALDIRPPGGSFPDGDTLTGNVERLWKELGGTAAAYGTWMNKPKASEATDSRWERPKRALPAFSLPDLEGKTWKLASLEGKVVLINLWATWCRAVPGGASRISEAIRTIEGAGGRERSQLQRRR